MARQQGSGGKVLHTEKLRQTSMSRSTRSGVTGVLEVFDYFLPTLRTGGTNRYEGLNIAFWRSGARRPAKRVYEGAASLTNLKSEGGPAGVLAHFR